MSDRRAIYEAKLEAISYIVEGETDLVAILSTVACELHHAFDYYDWTGFYRTIDGGLIVGPYQGTHGCLRIAFGDGVCGTAAVTQQTQLVPDVSAFVGHIACSNTTQSEIVVPIVVHGETVAVFDVDSDRPDAFDEIDVEYLERLARSLAVHFAQN